MATRALETPHVTHVPFPTSTANARHPPRQLCFLLARLVTIPPDSDRLPTTAAQARPKPTPAFPAHTQATHKTTRQGLTSRCHALLTHGFSHSRPKSSSPPRMLPQRKERLAARVANRVRVDEAGLAEVRILCQAA